VCVCVGRGVRASGLNARELSDFIFGGWAGLGAKNRRYLNQV
jgi:hypothetical protein